MPLLLSMLAGIVALVMLYQSGLSRSNPLIFWVAFAGILIVVKASDLISRRLDRTWGAGARGEERVGRCLADLESRGWAVFHDVEVEGWNIDHVAVGPTGVFTIETKSHAGRISFDGQKLLRNNRPLEKDFLKQAKGECMWLKAELADAGHTGFVTPIVCFTRAFVVASPITAGTVRVVPLKWLPQTLTHGKARYQAAELDTLQAAVRAICSARR
ncbi:MAG: hypothetical protein FJX76_20360 [Armatimonadetes bacterium]|nr:hypothetical protein [Armatimonadota bacterium]